MNSNWDKLLDPYVLAFFAYFLILLTEKVIFDPHSLLSHDHHIHKSQIGESPVKQQENDEIDSLLENCSHLHEVTQSQIDCKSCIVKIVDEPDCAYKDEVAIKNVFSNIGKFTTYMEASNAKSEQGDTQRIECIMNPLRQATLDGKVDVHEHHDPKQTSFFTALVLLVALSIHSFFAGLALGLQNKINDKIALAVGIIAHKWAESFSLVLI